MSMRIVAHMADVPDNSPEDAGVGRLPLHATAHETKLLALGASSRDQFSAPQRRSSLSSQIF